MNRTHVRRRRAAVGIVVLVGGLWAGSAASAGAQHPDPELRRYVVRTGDTLWAIAGRLGDPEDDPRPLIDAIEEANGIDGALQPGDVLRIPLSD